MLRVCQAEICAMYSYQLSMVGTDTHATGSSGKRLWRIFLALSVHAAVSPCWSSLVGRPANTGASPSAVVFSGTFACMSLKRRDRLFSVRKGGPLDTYSSAASVADNSSAAGADSAASAGGASRVAAEHRVGDHMGVAALLEDSDGLSLPSEACCSTLLSWQHGTPMGGEANCVCINAPCILVLPSPREKAGLNAVSRGPQLDQHNLPRSELRQMLFLGNQFHFDRSRSLFRSQSLRTAPQQLCKPHL